jgi:peroxiredoxin
VIPQLRVWYDRYKDRGFIIVGVHAPEFPWQRSRAKVEAAIKQLGINYPVVQDNDFSIWKRYGVWAWPTLFLIDKEETIRYTHIGEGAYNKTESIIKELLSEKAG